MDHRARDKRSEEMGRRPPAVRDADVLGGPEPAGEETDLMGWPEPAEEKTDLMGGPGRPTDVMRDRGGAAGAARPQAP